MKIAVGLFKLDKNSLFKYIDFVKYMILVGVLVVLISILGINILKSKMVNSNILYVASNIKKAEKTKVMKIDVMMALNKENTLLKNLQNSKVIMNEKKVKNVDKSDSIENTELNVSVVDSVDVLFKKDNDNLSITESNGVQKISVYGIGISNYSSKKNIDILSLFNKNITLTKKSDPVLIYSTHTSESYTNSERYKFDYTSLYRTQNAKYNMLSVGTVLSKALEERGVQTIFDTTPHDYGSYEIAYTNSRKTIENNLQKSERIGLSIDVHRDALGDLTQGPTVEINGQKVARLMFVMGVGTASYSNEYWEDNLALALQLQKLGEEMYPGIFRGMIIRNSKYNQDLIKHSFLVEVGTTGNTLEEAYFGARCLANILNKFYNN